MKNIIATLMIIAGVGLGLYVGVYLMLVGGIVQVVHAITATKIVAMDIAWGIVKIIFASFTGFMSAYFLIIPAVAIFTLETKRRKN